MNQLNIFDETLHECCSDPITGFFRDGFCNTNEYDNGLHIVCCLIDNKFLQFSYNQGNDLITPRPELNFPGLKEETHGVFVPSDGKRHMKMDVLQKFI